MTQKKPQKLKKKYTQNTAVSNLDLNINEGEMYGLLGVNGAGKTTTMKMLTTLIMPTSGEAELLGHSIKTDRAAVKQIIGISPQESAAAMNLTARENLELMAEVYGFSKKVAKAKASELIERFSMREFENRKAKKLSAESAVHCSQTFRHGFQTFGSIPQWSAVGSKTLQTHFRLPMP